MKVMIVGAAGFIGSTVAAGLIKSTNFQVVSVDNLSTISDVYNLEPARRATSRHQFYIANANDEAIMAKILKIERPSAIVFAIELDADGIAAVRSIAALCEKLELHPKVLVTTSHPTQTGTSYLKGPTPDFSDLPEHTLIFTCRVFGPRQHSKHFVPAVIYDSLGMIDWQIQADESDVQEWLYVGDFFKALSLVLSSQVVFRELCVSSGLFATEAEVASKIQKIVGQERARDERQLQSSIVSNTLNSSQIVELGWSPTADLDRALEHTLRWFSDNHQWALR